VSRQRAIPRNFFSSLWHGKLDDGSIGASVNSFNDLILPPKLLAALTQMKFEIPTPIQSKAIPVALLNRDVIGCSQTGSGKTAAFSIPIVSKMLRNSNNMALILVPTRELAIQAGDVLKQLTQFSTEIKVALLCEGASMSSQARAISEGARILVATPVRLLEHVHSGSASLSKVSVLVLDEADRMLDMGFAPQLNEVLRFLPKARQTMLFSATLPGDILNLSKKLLKDPAQIVVEPPTQVVQDVEKKTSKARQKKSVSKTSKVAPKVQKQWPQVTKGLKKKDSTRVTH